MVKGIFFNQSRLGYIERTANLQNQKLKTIVTLKSSVSHICYTPIAG